MLVVLHDALYKCLWCAFIGVRIISLTYCVRSSVHFFISRVISSFAGHGGLCSGCEGRLCTHHCTYCRYWWLSFVVTHCGGCMWEQLGSEGDILHGHFCYIASQGGEGGMWGRGAIQAWWCYDQNLILLRFYGFVSCHVMANKSPMRVVLSLPCRRGWWAVGDGPEGALAFLVYVVRPCSIGVL